MLVTKREGSLMTNGQAYELEDATYPLLEIVDAGVTIPEEIQSPFDAGWTWDGDKLVHPKDKDIWRMYTKVDSPKIGKGCQRLDAEVEQAVREARQRERRMRDGGQ
jgi:hypothetical protein